jgi:AcrR family transcriptional regulator
MSGRTRGHGKRRVPQQVRSRSRFERILEVTGDLVVTGGVESVNTRLIAAAAEVPVASLYQYFADKEEVLLALVGRDLEEMDAEVAQDLGRLPVLSVRSLVETTMRSHIRVYQRRPALVVIWLRGRTNRAINAFCRAHNRRVAHEIFELARSAGMALESATPLHAELVVEVADRLLQVAFESSLEGDPVIIEETIAVMWRYLETHATPEGIAGVPNPASATDQPTDQPTD